MCACVQMSADCGSATASSPTSCGSRPRPTLWEPKPSAATPRQVWPPSPLPLLHSPTPLFLLFHLPATLFLLPATLFLPSSASSFLFRSLLFLPTSLLHLNRTETCPTSFLVSLIESLHTKRGRCMCAGQVTPVQLGLLLLLPSSSPLPPPLPSTGSNSCSDGGGCAQLCLAFPGGRTCACGQGFVPSAGNTSCTPVPDGQKDCNQDEGKCQPGAGGCVGLTNSQEFQHI